MRILQATHARGVLSRAICGEQLSVLGVLGGSALIGHHEAVRLRPRKTKRERGRQTERAWAGGGVDGTRLSPLLGKGVSYPDLTQDKPILNLHGAMTARHDCGAAARCCE